MRHRWLLILMLMGLLALGVACGPSGPGDGIVRLVFFWSETCPTCHEIMEDFLPGVVEKYGDQLEIAFIEVTDPVHYEVYLAAIEEYNVPPVRQGVPAVYIGKKYIVGNEIPDQLEGLIEDYLDRDGVAYPSVPGLEAVLAESAGPDETGQTDAEAKPIHLAYFFQVGCRDCDRVTGDLNYLKAKYPQLVIHEFDVREHAVLSAWLGARAEVPTLSRLTAPTVFIGDDYLLEEELDARSLEELLIKYAPAGAAPVWENWEATAGESGRQDIVEDFGSFAILAIIFAGLVDGLNPCAFATLIFFVSYLTISGRKGKDVLMVGGAFTLGVFLAYTAVGFGFYSVLRLLADILTGLARWVSGFTAAFCLVVAVISFLDYLKARRGDVGDMALNLPHKLRLRINTAIRKTRNSQAFVAGAFVTGVVVSFLELACTGQAYLPTIVFVINVPELSARATALLILYNVMFILPLVAVFVLVYYGTGVKQFSSFLQRHASTVKLGLSFLFLLLGGWLAFSLL
jgi:cytochrome c biogenesis protein CcdA/thiol-disulfide isomerase/thioredoxin